jgi:hypothetical protein
MTLELGLRRFTLLPRLIQFGDDEPRKAHFLGKKEAVPVDKQDPGRRNDHPPQKQDSSKYRDLADITLGEVDAAITYFRDQLVVSPAESWIARNYFCELPLKRRTDEQSPIAFGRVRSSYPSDGNIYNIEQLELQFPRFDAPPDLLNIRRGDIQLQRPVNSFCVGVRMYLSEAEMQDFSRSETIFVEKGFAPVYETGYRDLLDVDEYNQSSHLWLNIIGSEWFAAIPETVKDEIRTRLHHLADWNKVLLNYHPRRYALQYLPLNDELGFHYGFTRHYLIAPQDTNQALQKVEETFAEIFMQGMSSE